VIIQPSTDLAPFAGQRVVIDHVRGVRIQTIRHDAELRNSALKGGVGGMCIEDPHGDCRGGSTAFWYPYGTDLSPEEIR
jgi:hypothetical protein